MAESNHQHHQQVYTPSIYITNTMNTKKLMTRMPRLSWAMMYSQQDSNLRPSR